MSNKMFKEEYIFAKYKDTSFKNAEIFKGEITKNYKGVDVDLTELYTRIVNYQVKKYGRNLSGDHRELIPIAKLTHKANKRKNMKKRYWGLHKEETK